MIAPFNFKKFNSQVLITNDLGRYDFLTPREFELFVNDDLDTTSDLYARLKDKYFLYDGSVEQFVESCKHELRYGKSYLFSATSLHIFVVTNFCNAKCVYCQAQSGADDNSRKMNREVAKAAVDIAIQSPTYELNFEFQGGEPLSNFPIIKYIVEYSESVKGEKNIRYSVVSNLSLLTEEMIDFFAEYNVSVSTSLDGSKELHNKNRPLSKNGNSYDLLIDKINKLKIKNINYGAIQTTTKASLLCSKQIVDEYIDLGLESIFIRPLTPLGHALIRWEEIGYTTEDFILFYEQCVDYLIALNKAGTFIKEGHASIFLSKILNGYGINYMELRSPCGASVGQIAYYYDGNVFTCDEGRMLYEMGDSSFMLGNVLEDDYDNLINSKLCKTICKYSIIESVPQCCDCAYQPYCGTCPVVNYAMEKDVISRNNKNYRCKIYKGMLDVLFDKLQDDSNLEVLRSWV